MTEVMHISPAPPHSAPEVPVPITYIAKTRTFSCDKYILPSDEEEKKRLQLQHRLLRRIYNDKLLLVPITFQPGDKILECGTGSGIWVVDMSSEIPASASIHGVDIASRLFPEPPTSNVHFSIASLTDLPRHWDDEFVLVHQRLLMAGLQHEDWVRGLSEMHRVLSPGGWVQLGEVGAWRAGPATAKHRSLVNDLFNSKGLLLECVESIPKWLLESGFVDIQVEQRSIPLGKWAGQDGIDGRDNWIEVFRAMKTPTLNAGGFGVVSSESEFDKLVDEVEQEWDDVTGAEMPFFIFYARKAKADVLQKA